RPNNRRSQGYSAGRTEGDDDEGDLRPFEEDRLEGHEEPDPVELVSAKALRPKLGELAQVDELLVVDGDDPRESKDRFAKPPETEEQEERADHALQQVFGNDRHNRHAERADDHREHCGSYERANGRSTPSAGAAYCRDDG